ncbi:hypothetical protein [Streptomyces sp. 1331.2]|uniref:hypothetical protein n=1 Tax=Streptomyces sp. 1331.2 TaxID=1938835 RepID=UPI000BD2474D|nr:hypothetical protein [Streptomyces sp. 1331.2]SOB81231.1 Sugar-specific transcriptional regulator TrmB [Streptomyces sp. 1331.2]
MEFSLFGLKEDEELVYREMLAEPGVRKQQISERLGWPVDRVVAALDDLARRSLVRPSVEQSGELRMVKPEVGLRQLLLQQENELLELQKQLVASRLAVTRLIDDATRSAPDVDGGAVRVMGADQILAHIEEQAMSCESEIAVFAPGGAQKPEQLDAARPLDRLALERGVRVRYVYLDSVRNDPATVSYARWLDEHGGEVRTVACLPPRMIVYDRTVALVPVDPTRGTSGVLVLTGAGVVEALANLFERVWSEATPFVSGRASARNDSGQPELGPQHQAVVQLMMEGFTDEVVARKIGVSVRTCRRITAEIMQQLGARSRFEAGARAMACGWLVAN